MISNLGCIYVYMCFGVYRLTAIHLRMLYLVLNGLFSKEQQS